MGAQAPAQDDEVCLGGNVLPARPKTDLRSVKVTGICYVEIHKVSYYKDINILSGGELRIIEARAGAYDTQTDLWASSIIIEEGGSLIVNGGVAGQNTIVPYGYLGGTVTIHLYGKNESKWNASTQEFDSQNKGSVCKSDAANRQGEPLGPCGIPKADVGQQRHVARSATRPRRPATADRRLLLPVRTVARRRRLHAQSRDWPSAMWDISATRCSASYGATLDLYGYKGITQDTGEGGPDRDPLSSGRSWRRLVDGQSVGVGSTSLWVERDLSLPNLQWRSGDEIVVTTTDYLPGHSEKLKITKSSTTWTPASGSTSRPSTIRRQDRRVAAQRHALWRPQRHSGPVNDPTKNRWTRRFRIASRAASIQRCASSGAETRAAVALLTRSIQIVSAGDNAGDQFPAAEDPNSGKPSYSYGAHMVIRRASRGEHQGRRVQADGPGRAARPLPRPFPHGAQDAGRHPS